MIKKMLISWLFKIVIGAIALGVGIWYISSSLGGASLSYTSVNSFMQQIGAGDGDVASVNGCFLCQYLGELFEVMGRATEMFWMKIVRHLWILIALGFGIFIISHTVKYMHEQSASKDIKNLENTEPKIDFKKWAEPIWKNVIRVLVAGALIGALNWSGIGALKTTTNLIVTPVMYIGTNLSMAATGVINGAKCEMVETTTDAKDILMPVLKPFMCVMGNLNTVMLAGAGGGFALMNYSWMGLGGGIFTWLAGLALVIGFLLIGFNLLFQVLTVIFKLIFIIIFMPMLIAAAAFEKVWSLAKDIMNSAITTLINSAVTILKISIKITIIYAVVFYAADSYYPKPEDGFTSIMPPLLGQITPANTDAKTMSIMNVFTTCEQVSMTNNSIDKEKFKKCFIAQKTVVEQKYPGAFDFMADGFDFLMFMIGIFFLYFWVISPEIDKLLNASKDTKETFDYGQWVKDVGKAAYEAPGKIYLKTKELLDKGT